PPALGGALASRLLLPASATLLLLTFRLLAPRLAPFGRYPVCRLSVKPLLLLLLRSPPLDSLGRMRRLLLSLRRRPLAAPVLAWTGRPGPGTLRIAVRTLRAAIGARRTVVRAPRAPVGSRSVARTRRVGVGPLRVAVGPLCVGVGPLCVGVGPLHVGVGPLRATGTLSI